LFGGSLHRAKALVAHKMLEPLAARAYRSREITGWPRWVGNLLEVKTPAAVIPLTCSSPDCGSNINIIFSLLDRTLDIPGEIVECGVFRGSSLTAMALYLKQRRVAKRIFGLDSFEGFDEHVHKDLQLGGADDKEKRVHGFDQTSLSHVYSKLKRLDLTTSVTLIQGYFSETLHKLPENRFSFVHLDCDIYASYKEALEYFYWRMSPGGIILLDEYNDPPWPGCNIAVDEFLVGKPETLTLIAVDNHEKYFIQKQ
jgi:O-methyltransferase